MRQPKRVPSAFTEASLINKYVQYLSNQVPRNLSFAFSLCKIKAANSSEMFITYNEKYDVTTQKRYRNSYLCENTEGFDKRT